MARSSPLYKATDEARWDAEDLFGRLAIVAHAGFLYAGLLPCDEPEATTTSLIRRYTLPQLVHREGADAVVIRLSRPGRRRGGGGQFAVVADVTSDGCQRNARRERIASSAVKAVLSGDVDAAARALRAPDAARGAWLWRLLADGLCRDLFLDLCGRNGVPVGPGFESLPADVKAAILLRLDAAEDVASVGCASKELRRLVAVHDAELWKARYEAIKNAGATKRHASMPLFVFGGETTEQMSWKDKYVRTRRRSSALEAWRTARTIPVPRTAPRVPYRRSVENLCGRMKHRLFHGDPPQQQQPAEDAGEEQMREAALVREPGWTAADGGNPTTTMEVHGDWYRKGLGAGAVHSPSSRYRWAHR
ncbi:hypothetical protein ACP70R_020700 [Stipagrostis hirtigluma subsp. patula]